MGRIENMTQEEIVQELIEDKQRFIASVDHIEKSYRLTLITAKKLPEIIEVIAKELNRNVKEIRAEWSPDPESSYCAPIAIYFDYFYPYLNDKFDEKICKKNLDAGEKLSNKIRQLFPEERQYIVLMQGW